MKRKILIITTKNCVGCSIQVEHVQTAIARTSKDIELEVNDFKELPGRILHKYKVTDYPATLFIYKDDKADEVVKFKYVGSCPVVMIQRYIDVYLK